MFRIPGLVVFVAEYQCLSIFIVTVVAIATLMILLLENLKNFFGVV